MWRSLETILRSIFWFWVVLACTSTLFIVISSAGDMRGMLMMLALTLAIQVIIAYGLKWGEKYSGRQRAAEVGTEGV